ncbi:MAG: carboxypeptidase-like regulatory domain-containing protein, partial [Myxococcota bacterium]|nr:carboxypeptidase-like regulatory domain-containing protein [Myxococcota bacterium]
MNPLWLLLGGPALGAALSGTVVDEAGEPVPGAVIQAYDVLLRAEETETDAMGRWRIEDLAAGTWRVRAVPAYTDNLVARWHPAAQDFCGGERLQLHASSEQAGVQITVPDGAAIRGRLVDSMGAPVVNEVVWAVGADEATESLVARPTLSGPTGEFVVRGLDTPPDGAGLWTLYARVDGFPDQYLGGVYDGDDAEPVVLSEGERTDVGTWGLNDGILVRGHAMGPGGPLAGASVHVYAGGQVVTVSSEDDGSWEAIGLPPGDVLPWVSAAGHALTYFPNHDRPTEYAGTVPTEGGLLDVGDILAPREARLFVDVVDADDGS